MEDTIREMMKDCSNSFSNIESDISDIVRQSQYRIINRLVEVFNEKMDFINENHLADPVISTYLPQILSSMKKINDKNHENLLEATRSLQGIASMGKSPEQISSIITFRTNEVTRRQNPERLHDINQEFTHDLVRTIIRRLEQLPLFSQNQLDNLYLELNHDIKHVLDKETDSLMEEYTASLNKHLKNFLKKCDEKLLDRKQTIDEAIEFGELKGSESILAKLGIETIDLFDFVQIKYGSGKYVSLYRQKDGSFITRDRSIELYINGPTDVILKSEDRVIHYKDGIVSFGPSKYPEQSLIEKSNGMYNIYYGGNLLTDPVKQSIVIERLRKNYPTLYDNMMRDNEFQALVSVIDSIDEKNNPYIVGENSRPIFNEDTKHQYYEEFKALGYDVLDTDEGFFLVDELGNHRVIARPSYIMLEDRPGVSIRPLLYIIVEKRITGPLFELETPDYSAIVSQDYSSVSLFSGDYHFALRVDGNEIVAQQTNRGSESLIDSGQSVIDKMQTMIPGIILKCQEKTKSKEITNLLDELEDKMVVEDEPTMSIDEELEQLMEDPNVRRYIELMKMKSEMESLSTPSGPRM